MPFSVILLMIAAFTFAGAMIYITHKQWISVWRGHRIRIRLQHFKISVEIDDVPVLVESQGLIRRTHQTEWEHPALGTKNIKVTKVQKGQDGLNLNLEIGDEIVPLFELPTNWLNQVKIEEEESYWKKLVPVEFENLGDPRWLAACKILQLTRQSHMANEEIRETANTLQQRLRTNFETRRRLAEEDVSLIGDSKTLNGIKTKIEEKIVQGLEAVKSLHMVTISLETHADETDEMEKVYQTIRSLQVEDEIAGFVQNLSQKNAKKTIAKAQKKEL